MDTFTQSMLITYLFGIVAVILLLLTVIFYQIHENKNKKKIQK